MEHPQDKEIQICLNKVPGMGSYMAHPMGLNFYIVIYRETIEKIFSRTAAPNGIIFIMEHP